MVEDAVQQTRAFLQEVERIQTNISQWQDSQSRATDLLAPKGWLLPLDTARTGTAAQIAEAKGIDAAEQALMAQLTPKVCRDMIRTCYDHPAFTPWKEHLLEALQAHEDQKYVLAVPVWIIIVDGVAGSQLTTVLGDDSIFGQMRKKDRDALVQMLGTEDIWQGYMRAFGVALGAVGQSMRSQPIPNPVLNRHIILHGRDPMYGREKMSLQCIVLMEGLAVGPRYGETARGLC